MRRTAAIAWLVAAAVVFSFIVVMASQPIESCAINGVGPPACDAREPTAGEIATSVGIGLAGPVSAPLLLAYFIGWRRSEAGARLGALLGIGGAVTGAISGIPILIVSGYAIPGLLSAAAAWEIRWRQEHGPWSSPEDERGW